MEELALHILDLMENSLAAGASVLELHIVEDKDAGQVYIELKDNGRGMKKEEAQGCLDPFFTTRKTRRVGLGLPLFRATAEACGGFLEVKSCPGEGTRVFVAMQLNHVDCPPLGDMGATIAAILSREEPVEIWYLHRVNEKEFTFSSKEVKTILGEIPLNLAPVLRWIKDYINEGLRRLQMEVEGNHEIPGGSAKA
ncbi:Histidine kinase-, DNA gyrase B-, and HSP90-like ATPase [Thermanaeromonas toyohensis ToBE]|uniref:histidine kinase n=1 Tax=Thermanaeromonas toyohensis ToBE TaxID=698762 RepID=A0A1W1VZX0_9FIRM|nr:ATP-binding protein [Thermanaeromonas toyohensis]SMB98922.1 Histidine kinase-, DNA gyrase B-, and HSP90-like ATPase [Thermanaeromonas toyohensis ToBE]